MRALELLGWTWWQWLGIGVVFFIMWGAGFLSRMSMETKNQTQRGRDRSMEPKLETDEDNGCLYVRFSKNQIARTAGGGSVNVDFDAAGKIVGIEILDIFPFPQGLAE